MAAMTADLMRTALLKGFFGEVPSQAAATAGAALFAFVSLMSLVSTARTRAWYGLVVVATGALECAGFAIRLKILAATPTLNLFIVHQSLLIISPVLLAIVDYLLAGRLYQALAPKSRAARWLSRGFTLSDVACLCIQGAGGALSSSADARSRDTGRVVLLVGLSLQLWFFTLFVATVWRVRALARDRGQLARLRPVLASLVATIALLYVRSVFRVVEFAQGWRGYLATHEVYFYLLDSLPVLLSFVFFAALQVLLAPAPRGKGLMPHDGGSSNGSGSGSHVSASAVLPAAAPRKPGEAAGHDVVVVEC